MQDVAVAALAPHRRVRGVIKLEGRSLAGTLGVECAVLCVCLPRRGRGRFAPRGSRNIGPRKVAWVYRMRGYANGHADNGLPGVAPWKLSPRESRGFWCMGGLASGRWTRWRQRLLPFIGG